MSAQTYDTLAAHDRSPLLARKGQERLSMVTAYDYATAQLLIWPGWMQS